MIQQVDLGRVVYNREHFTVYFKVVQREEIATRLSLVHPAKK